MILIVHDASDIFVALARFIVDTKYATNSHPAIIGTIYTVTLTIWIHMRIIVYPFCLLSNVYANRPTSKDDWKMISF